nr:hypothetical protein [Flavobacterium sp.]
MPLDNWLSDDILLKITKENAVAETAIFLIKAIKFTAANRIPSRGKKIN